MFTRSIVAGLFLTLVFSQADLYAQVKVLRVDPGQTDPAIATVHGPNLAVYDPAVPARHRLILFLVGTGGKAAGSQKLDSIFAEWGYHAISLDYENNILAASLSHSLDRSSFDRYRSAIVTGGAVNDKASVSQANSILNRFQKMLVYLAAHDPGAGWDEFLTNGSPVWSRVMVAGHSQGTGHAAYIGKLFSVDRVLLFSGPQDYLDNFNQPAPWQAKPGATDPSRFFAFLSTNDPFNVHHQIANCMALMQLPKPETLAVKPGDAIHGDYQIFINNAPAKQAHGSTLLPQFTNVWQYMVTNRHRSNIPL